MTNDESNELLAKYAEWLKTQKPSVPETTVLSRRDQFAMAALAGSLAMGPGSATEQALYAVMCADALIAELDKK